MLIQEMKKYQMLMDDTNSRFKDDLYESLIDQEAKKIYLEWRSMGAMLTESKLSQEQIQQIFGAIEAGAKAGRNIDFGMGSTIGDYGGDAPKRGIIGSLSQGWSNLKDKISQSRPISGFDVAFDKLQGKLLKAAGGESGTVGKMLAAYKKFGNTYPKIQSFLYYALTAAAAVSGWGLGATAVMAALRTINGLLQGDRLSSAAWKGIKTMALGTAANYIFGGGDGGEGGGSTSEPTPGPTPTPSPSPVTVSPGDTLSQIAQNNNVSVDQMLKANPQLTNPDVLKVGQSLNIPSPTGTAVYDKGIGTAADTIKKIGSGAYSDSGISRALAAKAGLKENINFNRMNRIWQTQKDLKMPQYCSVYLTKNGVENIFKLTESKIVSEGIFDTFKNKITKDKLDLFWRKNYGEYSQEDGVDSNTVIEFLRRMGVKSALIKNVFDELKIPMGTVTPQDTPATDTAASTNIDSTTDTNAATPPSDSSAAKPEEPNSEMPATATANTEPTTSITTNPLEFAELLKQTQNDFREKLKKMFKDYKDAGGEFTTNITRTMDDLWNEAKLGYPYIDPEKNPKNRMESKKIKLNKKKIL